MISTHAWNRKYRPKRVADLHLSQVREELQRFLERGKIPQALLFAGPKGTGKTSASRIIGAVLNDPQNEKAVLSAYFKHEKLIPLQEPSSDFSALEAIISGNSFVVIELDAASNRGIDDIRLLKERVQLPPQGALMAVYILDEVHMLTTEAFNALLKLLEEPPEHALFILATTELHKIPGTIASRCHQVQFTKASESELTAALTNILKQEKIKFEEPALLAIARLADGSFRDGVKLLESMSDTAPITLEKVSAQLNILPNQAIPELVDAILAKQPEKISQLFTGFRERNIPAKLLHTELLNYLHHSLLASLGVIGDSAVTTTQVAHFLLTQLASAEYSQASPIPLLPLELKLLELVLKAKSQGNNKPGPSGSSGSDRSQNSPRSSDSSNSAKSSSAAPADSLRETSNPSISEQFASPSVLAPTVNHDAAEPQEEISSEHMNATSNQPLDSVVHATPVMAGDGDGKLLCEKWPDFVRAVGERNMTVAALLQSAQPLEGSVGSAKIQVYYRFHQEQLSQPKFMQLADECLVAISGGRIQLEYILSAPPEQAEVLDAPVDEKLEKLATDALM